MMSCHHHFEIGKQIDVTPFEKPNVGVKTTGSLSLSFSLKLVFNTTQKTRPNFSNINPTPRLSQPLNLCLLIRDLRNARCCYVGRGREARMTIIRLTLHPTPRTTKSPITGEVFFFCREPFCFANNKNPLSQLSRFIIVAFTSSSPLSRIYRRQSFLWAQVVNALRVGGVVLRYFVGQEHV